LKWKVFLVLLQIKTTIITIILKLLWLLVLWKWHVVTDELSSSGDSKAEDDPDKKSPKDKDSKDRERDREEGMYSAEHHDHCV